MKRLLIIAAAIMVISNIAVFARVVYNRSEESQTIVLTERELSLPYYYYRHKEENSGIHLQLQWRTNEDNDSGRYYHNNHDHIVSREKLEELGFTVLEDCGVSRSDRGGRDQSRKAWVLLQYNGSAYQEVVEKQKQYLNKRRSEIGDVKAEPEKRELLNIEERLEQIKNFQTRLYVVDISLDKEKLQTQLEDSKQSFILAAEIANRSYCDEDKKVIRVSIDALLPSQINIPVQYHGLLASLTGEDSRKADELPRFEVEIALGKLDEPWVLGVNGID
ncbi:MAG: DUF4824 family protein [Gammaproteobacteria bacterium]|nr:DUF4824 family protein [Gammaproteobacteria bacterium]